MVRFGNRTITQSFTEKTQGFAKRMGSEVWVVNYDTDFGIFDSWIGRGILARISRIFLGLGKGKVWVYFLRFNKLQNKRVVRAHRDLNPGHCRERAASLATRL